MRCILTGMVRKAPFVLLLAAALCLLGCGNREAALAGEWKGEIEIPQRLKEDPRAQFLLAKVDTKASLSLKQDKTFVLKINNVPNEGSWSVAKDEIVLKVDKVAGRPWQQLKQQTEKDATVPKGMLENASDTVRFKIGEGDKSLSLIPGGTTSVQGNLTLHK